MERIDLDELLGWVNEVRATHALGPPLSALPKGQRGHALHCPMARALSIANGPRIGWPEGHIALVEERVVALPTPHAQRVVDRVRVALPPIACDFIRGFDEGLYPELVE